MIEISNIALSLDDDALKDTQALGRAASQYLGIQSSGVSSCKILKRSVDARKKRDVHFVVTISAEIACAEQEDALLAQFADNPHVRKHVPYRSLDIVRVREKGNSGARPIIIGSGPAGLCAAYYLAEAGLRPIVYERGADVDTRIAQVEAFSKNGLLNENSNISFGEGGAGTFSDGKLATNIKDPYCAHILHWFVNAGAPSEILWQAKPHIGTDRLVHVVKNLRKNIIDAGGEFFFGKQLTGLRFDRGRLHGIEVTDISSGHVCEQEATQLILAIGHSARDTFKLLDDSGVYLEQKSFSLGVRIEHLQASINHVQYGEASRHPALGAADYRLVTHLPKGRSVYTFCMCPGGEVVCSSNEPDALAVNGMSRYARDGRNANSALLVEVGPEDFGDAHPLAGIAFQRKWEQAAYRVGSSAGIDYQAPAQSVGSFLSGSASKPSPSVQPSYARGVVWSDLHRVLPAFVCSSIHDALPIFGRKLQGFDDPGAVMTGVETRSSSPVRIKRGSDAQAFQGPKSSAIVEYNENKRAALVVGKEFVKQGELLPQGNSGIYPCGEGAGYAGGIMSSAVDGLRAAEALVILVGARTK